MHQARENMTYDGNGWQTTRLRLVLLLVHVALSPITRLPESVSIYFQDFLIIAVYM